MYPKSSGRVPRGPAMHGPSLALIVSAFVAGGCSHTPSSYEQPNWYAGGPRPAPAVASVPIEMEDDGRPGQLPPRAGGGRIPDDPREPWSPNYGGPATPVRAPVPVASAPATDGRTPTGERARRIAWTGQPG
jgi:hypothetical protein